MPGRKRVLMWPSLTKIQGGGGGEVYDMQVAVQVREGGSEGGNAGDRLLVSVWVSASVSVSVL